MKIENRLNQYKEQIETCKGFLKQHRKSKKETIRYHNFWIKNWEKKLKKLKGKYHELQKMRTL